MAWVRLRRFLKHLEKRGEVLRINRPVDVAYEAGAIADLLVKNDGPAVVFEQPRLADGSISPMPLVMHPWGRKPFLRPAVQEWVHDHGQHVGQCEAWGK